MSTSETDKVPRYTYVVVPWLRTYDTRYEAAGYPALDRVKSTAESVAALCEARGLL
jgi:hypothetical protein